MSIPPKILTYAFVVIAFGVWAFPVRRSPPGKLIISQICVHTNKMCV